MPSAQLSDQFAAPRATHGEPDAAAQLGFIARAFVDVERDTEMMAAS